MKQPALSEQSAQDSLQKERGAPVASSVGLSAQRQEAAFADSPHQVAQKQTRDRFQNASRQTAQRQHLDALQRAPSEAGAKPVTPKGGLPNNLKNGVESLSGISMDHVRVHYNSAKPAQLNAFAYAQGTDIHLGPGQEKHLPHEAWHVVQQAQGRVQPTMQMKEGVPINDNKSLEREADVMGAKAMQLKALITEKINPLSVSMIPASLGPLQRQALVVASDQSKERVVIEAEGDAKDFQGGAAAKDSGWNGVKKYKADARVGKTNISIGMINNKFIVGQAGHVLAQQNGGDGGDKDNVFAQDGGVNNGPYRSDFENPMRRALDDADDDDKVKFRAVLYGDDIKQGALVKNSDNLEGSDEDTDFEGF